MTQKKDFSGINKTGSNHHILPENSLMKMLKFTDFGSFNGKKMKKLSIFWLISALKMSYFKLFKIKSTVALVFLFSVNVVVKCLDLTA